MTKLLLESELADSPFFSFDIAGTPVPKGRPRVTRSGHVYTPQKTREYENKIRKIAFVEMTGRKSLQEPVRVCIEFFFQPPRSMSKKGRAALLEPPSVHAIKPDLDNLIKAVLDSICGYRLPISDDKLVAQLIASKKYATQPSVKIRIYKINN